MKKDFYESFTLNYSKLLNLVNEFSNVVFTFLKTLLNTIVLLPILVGVLAVEIPRVQLGIQIFDKDVQHSALGASVLVLSLLTFQFLLLYIESQSEYVRKIKYKFSLRLLFTNLKYFVGLEKLEEKHNVSKYESVTKLIEFGVIFLSAVGSLQESIKVATEKKLSWHQAIIDIIINSDAKTFFDAAVSIVFAVVIVRMSTTLTYHIGQVAIDALANMKVRHQEVIDKFNAQLKPKEFFEIYRSRLLSGLEYLPDDYFINNGNMVQFYDSNKNELSKEYNITNLYQKKQFSELIQALRGQE